MWFSGAHGTSDHGEELHGSHSGLYLWFDPIKHHCGGGCREGKERMRRGGEGTGGEMNGGEGTGGDGRGGQARGPASASGVA